MDINLLIYVITRVVIKLGSLWPVPLVEKKIGWMAEDEMKVRDEMAQNGHWGLGGNSLLA